MDLFLLLPWLHLLALGPGLAGVWSRGRALRDSLRDPEDAGAVRRALVGHTWWQVAVVAWLVTGVWQLFAADRVASTYFGDTAFLLKLAMVSAIVALELWPVTTLLRWRTKHSAPNQRDAGRLEIISYVQCGLVAAIVLAAARTSAGPAPAAVREAHRVATARHDTTATRVADGDAVKPAITPSPLAPTGVETVTGGDMAMLTRAIAMPLDGVDPARLRSNFDEPRGGGRRVHQALDIMAPSRTPIKSAAKGRLLKLFTSAAGGLMVYAADSSERFIFLYAHLDGYAPGLREGAALERGQLIGFVGSTGNASASAPHLHFAIARSADVKRWSRGKPIDPLPILVASAAAAQR